MHDIVQPLKNQKTEAEKDEEARGRVNKTWNAKGFDKHVTKLDNLSRAYSASACLHKFEADGSDQELDSS